MFGSNYKTTNQAVPKLSAASSNGASLASQGAGEWPMPAPDFRPYIEKLLGLAGIANTPDARDALDRCLQGAWCSSQLADLHRKSAPPELFKQLKTSIKKTQQLLRQLGAFPPTEDIKFDMLCYLEEGTITVAANGVSYVIPLRDPPPLGSYLDFEVIPAGATRATINRQRVLDRLLRDLDRSKPKRKRGGQRNAIYQAVVGFAGLFFREYSSAKLTTYPGGEFVSFCKLFYEIATGASPLDDYVLDTQIRAEVKSPRLGVEKIKS